MTTYAANPAESGGPLATLSAGTLNNVGDPTVLAIIDHLPTRPPWKSGTSGRQGRDSESSTVID